jgi:DNA-binding PadR family transcriptional regulator
MSEVRLFVLGVVRLRGQAHGYAVHRELRVWNVEAWTDVKLGSIYHALKQLTKEGKLRAVAVEDSAAGPDRTLYALTAAGADEFRRLVDAALTSVRLETLSAAVAFMQALPRAQVLERLREQQRLARNAHDCLDGMIPGFPERAEPPHSADLLALWSATYAAQADWTAALIRRLEAGEYCMADDGPDKPPTP